jgi:hypothetical protein
MIHAFGTDHIVYVPEEEVLSIHDLYSWRVMRFSVHEFRARLRKTHMQSVEHQSRQLLGVYLSTPEGEAEAEKTSRCLDAFLGDLLAGGNRAEGEPQGEDLLCEYVAPQTITFWLRMSDAPAESFFKEDYTPSPPTVDYPYTIPVYGTVSFRCMGDAELAFPETGDASAFALDMRQKAVCVISCLDAGVPLPILHEYCGFRGASNRGVSANYTLRGELAPESLGCVPLHRIGFTGFATLYFHLGTELTCPVSLRVRGERFRQAEERLKTLGYECRDEGPCHQIWHRLATDDILHFYHDLPGKESEGVRFIPSFVLAARAGGRHTPEERARLIAEIAGKKHPRR